MSIASGIFWIMAGLLYVLYRAFKEHPSETMAGVVAFLIIFGCIVGFTLTYRWLMDVNLVLGTVFVIGVLGFAGYKFHKMSKNEQERRQKILDEYNEEMDRVRESMTEKDYEDFARENCYRYHANMNKESALYWKNEPYYSKIKWAAEINRSGQLAVKRDREKLKNKQEAGL